MHWSSNRCVQPCLFTQRFRWIFSREKYCVSFAISPKFVHWDEFKNKSALIWIMARQRHRPLSEPTLIKSCDAILLYQDQLSYTFPPKKSDILERLDTPSGHVAAAKQVTFVVSDMAEVIHMVRPTTARTLMSMCQSISYQAQINGSTERIDAVWDNYPEVNNLKALTQQGRGNGPRTTIGDGSTPIPKHEWNSSFLKNAKNKKELPSSL